MRQDAPITTSEALLRALKSAKPGTRLTLTPGEFASGLFVNNIQGAAGKPIVIEAADPKRPPVFRGRGNGMQLSEVAYLELRNLHFLGATDNGLNIDDGKKFGSTHHITLQGLRVGEMNVRGNNDGIKLSGITDFALLDCTIERWGVGGQGVDMVGCHRGRIEGCTVRQIEEEQSAGIQMKGGSMDITVRRCRFEKAGGRALNLGGSTGLEFFRPALIDLTAGARRNAEARKLLVEECTIEGGGAAFAFLGSEDVVVRRNTIKIPGRWAVRILQENRHPSFLPCRKGVFEENLILFDSRKWGSGGVNIGDGTAPGYLQVRPKRLVLPGCSGPQPPATSHPRRRRRLRHRAESAKRQIRGSIGIAKE
ncbi:MAG: right-handed parallel beta-helix repeat-containing protein [Armatimonas sp.]